MGKADLQRDSEGEAGLGLRQKEIWAKTGTKPANIYQQEIFRRRQCWSLTTQHQNGCSIRKWGGEDQTDNEENTSLI